MAHGEARWSDGRDPQRGPASGNGDRAGRHRLDLPDRGARKWLGAEPFSAVGFLKSGTTGAPWLGTAADGVVHNPTHDFWVGLAGNATLMPLVNWLVVFGEIAIGAALMLGLFTRFAALMGTVMMAFFFVAMWDFSHGLVTEQFLIALVTGYLGYLAAGRYYGVDSVIEKATTVKHAPPLRYVLG